jgi:hypothetical protein
MLTLPGWQHLRARLSTVRQAGAVALVTATLLLGCGGGGDTTPNTTDNYQPSQGTKVLGMTPVAQQTHVWCWAASAEMVLEYFRLPNLNPGGNYQCGIVAVYYGPNSTCWYDCFSCVATIGTATALQSVINGYGYVASQFGPSRILTSRVVFAPLSFNATAQQIDQGRPLVAGISPHGYSYPNVSEHAVVIVGYQNEPGVQRIIINDPFPYGAYATPDPYTGVGGVQLAPGRYSISYTTLISSLRWGNTIDQIH